jgi:Icc protein
MQRRTLIKRLGGLVAAPVFPFSLLADPGRGPRRPVLRLAHLTDVHLKDKWEAPARWRRCLAHVQSRSPAVELILNGGDIVFDMNKENLDTIQAQWKLWHSILKEGSSLPIHYCLGNHDIWWNEDDKGQVLYGKQFSMDQVGLSAPYYSVMKAGWKFIVLDSCHLDIDNTWYIGKLGEVQFAWLQQELEGTAAEVPVLVLSHIPILTATQMVADDFSGKWELLGGDMHTDVVKITELFYRFPNVKLCLSGHVHIRDKVVYNNVTYICNGAVSGAWWEGFRRQTMPGYGLIDLYADGSFDEAYVNY